MKLQPILCAFDIMGRAGNQFLIIAFYFVNPDVDSGKTDGTFFRR